MVRLMLTELGLQRTESTVLQYCMEHEPYEARISVRQGVRRVHGMGAKVPFSTHFWLFGRVHKGCMSPH